MAYMNQEKKAKIAPAVKAILKEYGVKGSLSVQHHSTLILTMQSGKLDILGNVKAAWLANTKRSMDEGGVINHITFNEYYLDRDCTDDVLAMVTDLRDAMMAGNHDRSDVQSDYFDVGWYITIRAGTWEKPYIHVK